VFADLKADLFIPQVWFNAKPLFFKGFSDIPHVFGLLVRDVEDDGLHRGEPSRKGARVFFDQNPQKALDRTKDGPMQHDRDLLRPIIGDVMRIESTRHRKIDLQSAALPESTD
jgi:hypothetical protein